MSGVYARKVALSGFILAVCLLQFAQGALQIENFPLTTVGMFRAYRAPGEVPWTFTVEALRRGKWVEVRPWMLQMRPGTMEARLGSDLGRLAERCGALGELHNRAARPRQRWERLRARVERRAPSGEVVVLDRVECRLPRRGRAP